MTMLPLLSIAAVNLLLFLVALNYYKKYCYGTLFHRARSWLPLLGCLFSRSPTVASLSTVLQRLPDGQGPIVTLWTGSKPAIFIAQHAIAHRTLIRMGATFAQRPRSFSFGVNFYGINSAAYNNRWAVLRRNLSSHLAAVDVGGPLQQSIDRLVKSLELAAREGVDRVVVPSDRLRHAVFCFFAALCFGEGLADHMLVHLRGLHAEILSLVIELDAWHIMPVVLQLAHYFPRWWKLYDVHKRLRPGDREMVSLCWEFMNAAAKTTTTALEWIMARLVLHQDIQQKLWNDIARRAGGNRTTGGERPFVEAVVLEALRRHPPAPYLLPHTTDRDVSLDGYLIPKGSVVNYGVAEIGRDTTLWSEPDVFIPERFLEGGEGSIIRSVTSGNSSPEMMKMMPFGAGRRACPGAAAAMKVLQSFVEDLVKRFEWKPISCLGKEMVDMSEKPGLVAEMRTPFRTRLVMRQHD